MATATPITQGSATGNAATGACDGHGAFDSTTPETVELAGALAREAALHPSPEISPWFDRIAVGLGVMRIGLGAAAIAVPEQAGRMWIGDGALGRDRAVLVRALGGRDVALGIGALLAARRGRGMRRWVLMGALSDFVDTLASTAGFTELPKWRRWLVLGASGGAALTGVLVAPNVVPTSA